MTMTTTDRFIDLAQYNLHRCLGWERRRQRPCRAVISLEREFCPWHHQSATVEQLAEFKARPIRKLVSRIERAREKIDALRPADYANADKFGRAKRAKRAYIRTLERKLAALAATNEGV